jgi:hypothetical protein
MRAMTPLVATTFVGLASGAFALALLLSVMSGASLAQTTGTVNPSEAPAEPSVKEDVPTGGCMPIGLTASGEIVFPIQCRELIEQQREKAVERKPTGVEEKAVVDEEKPVGLEEKPVGLEEKSVGGEEKPVGVEEKRVGVEEKAATKQSEDVAPKNSQPAIEPAETVSLPKRVQHKPRERGTANAQGRRPSPALPASAPQPAEQASTIVPPIRWHWCMGC